MNQMDVIIIGAGPGGYVAAIKAAQLGFKVACIEKRETLGGTCLNVGCIPSKALLHSSEKFEDAKLHFKDHGIDASVKLDLAKMLGRKDQVVKDLTAGIAYLFKKNGVTHVQGSASFKDASTLIVTKKDGKKEEWSAKHIIIATGSEIMSMPGVEIDEKQVVSSTGALTLSKVPNHLVVVGGGYIGLEMGSVWRRLGAKVTVVEFADRIVPAMDLEVGKALHKVLEKQGMNFKLGTKVTKVVKDKKGVVLSVEPAAGGKAETFDCDVLLMSIGRRPNTDNLNLEAIGITKDERGRIPVDKHFKTSVAGVYAIGDVIDGPMLAHKAEEEGVALVEMLAGQAGHVNYDVIPAVVYTHPEVATVGKTEEELKKAGISYKAGKFPFAANSRAKANGDTDGFVKILACDKTDMIYGVHIIGAHAGTMIAQAAVAMEFKAASEDLARTCHAHPTANEAIKEAALATFFKPINF